MKAFFAYFTLAVGIVLAPLAAVATYHNNFDSDNGGWVADAAWQWGSPTNPNGPQAHSSPNVWAVGLTRNYDDGVCGHLDLSLGAEVYSPNATLEFWYWYQLEQNYDGCNVKVSVDGGNTWGLVVPQGGYTGITTGAWWCNGNHEPVWTGITSGMQWQYAVIPIGGFINQTPIFRIEMGSDGSLDYAGFFLDDVSIRGVGVELNFEPPSLAFDVQDVGSDTTRSLSLLNETRQSIAVHSVSHALQAFTVDTSGLNGAVQPHSTYQMNLTFAPTAIGSYLDTLVIVAGQPDSVYRIPLSGEAEILLPPVDSLVIKRGTGNNMQLNWAAITHTISGRPFTPPYYVIYGATTVAGPWVPLDASPTNSYTHVQFVLQPEYFYRVTGATEEGMRENRKSQIGRSEPGR